MLGLLDPEIDADRLGRVLARFEAFWTVAELAVDAWAERSPALAAQLDWPRRRRATSLRDDRIAFGAEPVELPTALALRPATDAQVLGWLYVSEGSTLGGAVLSRHLTPRGLTVASFTPYPEGPGPMWRRFATVLDSWIGTTVPDPVRVEDVAAAALTAFTALAAWVAALGVEAAA